MFGAKKEKSISQVGYHTYHKQDHEHEQRKQRNESNATQATQRKRERKKERKSVFQSSKQSKQKRHATPSNNTQTYIRRKTSNEIADGYKAHLRDDSKNPKQDAVVKIKNKK